MRDDVDRVCGEGVFSRKGHLRVADYLLRVLRTPVSLTQLGLLPSEHTDTPNDAVSSSSSPL